jgi:hypothetical protein
MPGNNFMGTMKNVYSLLFLTLLILYLFFCFFKERLIESCREDQEASLRESELGGIHFFQNLSNLNNSGVEQRNEKT